MRILHLASEHPPQTVFGLGRYVCDMARELAAQRNEVHVLTNSICGKDQDVVDHGVNLHRIDFPPPPKPPGSIPPACAFNLQLQQRAARLGYSGLGAPEVVVSHDWLTALAGHHLARRFGVPHVWTVHDTVFGKRAGELASSEDRQVFELERWAAHTADLILVNSTAIREEISVTYAADLAKVRLVHCGIDPSMFKSRQAASRLTAFRQVFAAPDEMLVTYVGRLDLEKGIDVLVNAFAALHRKMPNARLAIIGTGQLVETIRSHVQALELTGAVNLYG